MASVAALLMPRARLACVEVPGSVRQDGDLASDGRHALEVSSVMTSGWDRSSTRRGGRSRGPS